MSRLPKLENTWHRLLARLDSSNSLLSHPSNFTDTNMSTPSYGSHLQKAHGQDTESSPVEKDRYLGKVELIQVSNSRKALGIYLAQMNLVAVGSSLSANASM